MNEFAQMFSSLIKISIVHRETTFPGEVIYE